MHIVPYQSETATKWQVSLTWIGSRETPISRCREARRGPQCLENRGHIAPSSQKLKNEIFYRD